MQVSSLAESVADEIVADVLLTRRGDSTMTLVSSSVLNTLLKTWLGIQTHMTI